MRHLLQAYVTLVLAIVVGVAFLLSWQTQSEWTKEHARLLLELNDVDALLDTLMPEVISLAGNRESSVAAISRDMQALHDKLYQHDNAFLGKGYGIVDTAFERHWAVLEQKRALLQRASALASRQGLTINQLSQAAEQLQGSEKVRALHLLDELYRSILLRGSAAPAAQLAADLLGPQAGLQQNSSVAELVKLAQTTLDSDRELKDLQAQFKALPSTKSFNLLNFAYRQHRSNIRNYYWLASLALAITGILLSVGVWMLLRHLSRARLEARRSLDRLDDAVNSLSEGFALINPKGKLVTYNQRMLDYYPWLADAISRGTDQAEMQLKTEARVRYYTPEGEPIKAPPRESLYLEHVDEDRWYLATNNLTSSGDIAVVRMDVTRSKEAEFELKKVTRVLEQSPSSVVITDIDGKIEYVNPRFISSTGYSARQLLGKTPFEALHTRYTTEDEEALWAWLRSGKNWRGTVESRNAGGEPYWEAISITPLRDEQGQVTHFIGVGEDVTQQLRSEKQLEINAAVFDAAEEGIFFTDSSTRITSVNKACVQILGYSREELIGQTPQLFRSGRHGADFYDAMWQSIKAKGSWTGEIWNQRKDGTLLPERLSVIAITNDAGEVAEYVAVFTDLSQDKAKEQRILYQATHDAVTGLPNRSLMLDRLIHAIDTSKRESWKLALLFVDLDRFKAVNDTYGHSAGDDLIRDVAKRLKQAVRESDTVARFGGDEFIILLQDIREDTDAASVAAGVLDALARPFEVAGNQLYIGASIGISLYPLDAENADDLLLNADLAMYQAKQSSKSCYCFFISEMQEEARVKQLMEQDLRLALANKQLALHYQPIVRADNDELVGFECLLRWNHHSLGPISPNRFISIAEDTGVIDEIGRWTIDSACRQLAAWDKLGDKRLNISINISSRQRELGLQKDCVAGILAKYGIAGSRLTLEMTESLLLDNTEEAISWLKSMKSLDITLSIDDFGTGYSSLSYLKRFPFDYLKIDRSFVQDIPEDQDDAALVNSIVAMSRSLGLAVVAEGVEDQQQVRFLRELGCEYLQGFLFGKPVPAGEAGELILNWDGSIRAARENALLKLAGR